MGCSPYFATTGTNPLLPIDIAEANYLLPPPDSTLTTTELITRRAITLQKRPEQLKRLHYKVYSARIQAATQFEEDYKHTLHDFDFKLGDLVLVRNTAIEKALNRKMRSQYLGPVIVLGQNKGGAYVLSELDGTVFHRPVAAFRIIPYFPRKSINLPPLDDLLDISRQRLQELKNSEASDPDEDEDQAEFLPDD